MNPQISFGEMLVSIEQTVAFQEEIGRLRGMAIINQRVLCETLTRFHPVLSYRLWKLAQLNNQCLSVMNEADKEVDELIVHYLKTVEPYGR